MYRLPGDRITLDLDGPTVEIEPIRAWAVLLASTQLGAAYVAASDPVEQYTALAALAEFFLLEAQPQWNFADHRGPIRETVNGFLRLTPVMQSGVIAGWQATYEEEKSSAVDAVIEPGPANLEIKRRLRAVKAA